MAHEHGHGLGLEHACPLDKTKIMENKVPMTVAGYAALEASVEDLGFYDSKGAITAGPDYRP